MIEAGNFVIPAQAGIESRLKRWMPAFAGMTDGGVGRLRIVLLYS